MDFFEGLHAALSIDRLVDACKLIKPDPDPIMNTSNQIMEGVLETFFQLNVDHRYQMGRQAQDRERQQPGYIEQLNRQRASLGLPLI